MWKYLWTCIIHVLVHTHIFLLCQLRGPGNDDSSGAMSTLNAQILISNIISQEKEPGLLREMADSRNGAGKIIDEPRASCSTRK